MRLIWIPLVFLLGSCTNESNLIYNNNAGSENNANNTPNANNANNTNNTNNVRGTNSSNSRLNNSEVWCPPNDARRFAVWENGAKADVSRQRVGGRGAETLSPGVGIFDLDNDGDRDLIVTSSGSELTYLVNDGRGNFTDGTEAAGLSNLTTTTSVSGADFDGDGDVDLLIGRSTGVYFLVNEDGRFVDRAEELGVYDPVDVVSGATFVDFDGDRDLDVYISSYIKPVVGTDFFPVIRNRLLRNDDGIFRRVTTSPGGKDSAGMTLGAAWWDFDDDGRPDLWVVNDFGMVNGPNQLWRNLGPDPSDPDNWLFEDIAAEVGLDVRLFGMSATLADFDNDGDQDGYVSNMMRNVFHVRDGNMTQDEAQARGVAVATTKDSGSDGTPSYGEIIDGMDGFFASYADTNSTDFSLTSWTSIFFDADQDGWQDLFVSNGMTGTMITPEAPLQPNAFFFSSRGDTFERAPCWMLSDQRGATRGAAVGDLDGDGDLDLVWANNGDAGVPGVFVRRNDVADGNWLIVELKGRAPNTDAIGAKVVLTANGQVQTRWIDGGQGYLSVNERIAHYGIGSATDVQELMVIWPGGQRTTVPNVDINQRIVVSQPLN